MPQPDLFPLIDRLVQGGLEAFLLRRRGEGDSYQQIAFDLKRLHDVDLSVETVRRWCIRLDAKAQEVAG